MCLTNPLCRQQQLEAVSETAANVDEAKGKTLNEISRIVTDISQVLKEKKNKLAPQIKELRAVRQQFSERENEYLGLKSTYENTKAGLDTDQVQLEQECDMLQDECLQEESRFHYMNAVSKIIQTQQERADQEAKFQKGEGQLMRDFKTWTEFFTNKVTQQENLAKEMRQRKKHLQENEGYNIGQRQQFLVRRVVSLRQDTDAH